MKRSPQKGKHRKRGWGWHKGTDLRGDRLHHLEVELRRQWSARQGVRP